MVAPIVALGLRWAGTRALSMIFGSTTRTGLTAITADQALNGGRLTSAAAGAVADGIGSIFRRAVGMDGPDGQFDWTRVAGMGTAVAVGTMLLDKMMGTPMALIASLALAYIFRDKIGEMAGAVRNAFSNAAAPDSATMAPAAAATTPGNVPNPSPEFQQGLADLSRLSRGLALQPN